MLRREFIVSLFSGAAVGAPFSARGASSGLDEAQVPLAVRCEQLPTDLQDANRRLAETDEHLSQVYLLVHQMNCVMTVILTSAELMQSNTHGALSDEVRKPLNFITDAGERMGSLIREVFERARARRKVASADVIAAGRLGGARSYRSVT
jgi:light-regulated signal transduction histidine kinase (bacteriophytochrome)